MKQGTDPGSEEEFNPFHPSPVNTQRELTNWADIRPKLMQDKDFNSTYRKLIAVPVRYKENNANPRWEPIAH